MTITKVKLGALVVNGFVLTNPERPWGYEGEYAPSAGDIPEYKDGEIQIIDSADPEALISWIPVEHNGKSLLIADRNLLNRISWDQLNEQGLIFGKEIEIRGKRYKLRVLTGGNSPLDDDCELGGFPEDNEWDLFIANRAGLDALPKPTEADFDEYVTEESFKGEHNQYWNWAYTYSWCQDTHHEFGSRRAIRGYFSARLWLSSGQSGRSIGVGWRPVLEVLNSETPNSDDSIENRLKDLSEEELKNVIEAANEEMISRRVKSHVTELVDALMASK